MPLRYTAEMCCDRIAACRVYHGKNYKQGDALEYFMSSNAPKLMHRETAEKLREWLTLIKEQGENYTFKIIKAEIKKDKLAKARR